MTKLSWTPGRVNLIGEWIDFNGGTVLPAPLPMGVSVKINFIDGAFDTAISTRFGGVAKSRLNDPAQGRWADYIFGALQVGREQGWIKGAANVALDSHIPVGAGVSSSAAVTVGVLRAIAPDSSDPSAIALLAQQVENEFIGVPCGVMDQFAVATAKPGEALALNTKNLTFERLELPEDWVFCVIHSGVDRELVDGHYKARRDACLQAAEHLGIKHLCDAKDISNLPDHLFPFARHAVTEHVRALEAITAMKRGDCETFGALMTRSHASLRDDFMVSTLELDALADRLEILGAKGARLTGAGFGGCVAALFEGEAMRSCKDEIARNHPQSRWICDVSRQSANAVMGGQT